MIQVGYQQIYLQNKTVIGHTYSNWTVIVEGASEVSSQYTPQWYEKVGEILNKNSKCKKHPAHSFNV